MTPVDPIRVLREATRRVPSVKYALGVAGVAAAGALVVSLLGYREAAPIVLGGIFVGMVLLYVFATMVASKEPGTRTPGVILLYAVTLFFCSFLFFTVTAFAFAWPDAWACVVRAGPCGLVSGPGPPTPGPPAGLSPGLSPTQSPGPPPGSPGPPPGQSPTQSPGPSPGPPPMPPPTPGK